MARAKARAPELKLAAVGVLAEARTALHAGLIQRGVLALRRGVPSNADGHSAISSAIAIAFAASISARTGQTLASEASAGQTQGDVFASLIAKFLRSVVDVVSPVIGGWTVSEDVSIEQYLQYAHLGRVQELVLDFPELRLTLGTEYVVAPDVVVSRRAIADLDLPPGLIAEGDLVAQRSALRSGNLPPLPLIHASVSCKWTIRSDRAQNSRTEALNLIRNRKGRAPAIVVVTAEPEPSRLASLAYGTGDFDRIYHVGLDELVDAVVTAGRTQPNLRLASQQSHLESMIGGGRLSDISDLALDLAI